MIITNESIKNALSKHSFFDKAVRGIKNYIASKLGVKDLLLAFRDKHCKSSEAKTDFDFLIEKLGIDLQ